MAEPQLLGALVAELGREVDLTALERGHAGLILEDLHVDGVDRGLSAPVVRVGLELKPAAPRFSFSLNGPVPFILAVHSPGFVRSEGSRYVFGRMIA